MAFIFYAYALLKVLIEDEPYQLAQTPRHPNLNENPPGQRQSWEYGSTKESMWYSTLALRQAIGIVFLSPQWVETYTAW